MDTIKQIKPPRCVLALDVSSPQAALAPCVSPLLVSATLPVSSDQWKPPPAITNSHHCVTYK